MSSEHTLVECMGKGTGKMMPQTALRPHYVCSPPTSKPCALNPHLSVGDITDELTSEHTLVECMDRVTGKMMPQSALQPPHVCSLPTSEHRSTS